MKNNKPTPPKKVTKRVINTKPVEDAATKKARVDAAVLNFIKSLPDLENPSESDDESEMPFFLTVKSPQECIELVESSCNANDIEDYSSAWLAILQEVFEGVQLDPQEDSDSEEDPEPELLTIELVADIYGFEEGVPLSRVTTTNPFATRNLWLQACPKLFSIKKKL